jgi:hypothetical protein
LERGGSQTTDSHLQGHVAQVVNVDLIPKEFLTSLDWVGVQRL